MRVAELLLFNSASPGVISAGIHVELAPGWHLYWSNPGDAGLAPVVSWRVPAGYEPGPLRFPTPEKFVEGELVVYGYEGEVLLLCDLKAPPAGPTPAPVVLTAILDWMACRESCLIGRENLTAGPGAVPPAELKRSQDILDRFADRYPKPADPSWASRASAEIVRSGSNWTVEIAIPENAGSPVRDFYPHPIEGFVIAYSRVACRDGRISIPLIPSENSAGPSRVSGLLITGKTGIEIDLPVRPSASREKMNTKEVPR